VAVFLGLADRELRHARAREQLADRALDRGRLDEVALRQRLRSPSYCIIPAKKTRGRGSPRSKPSKASASKARLISSARSPRKLKRITASPSRIGPTARRRVDDDELPAGSGRRSRLSPYSVSIAARVQEANRGPRRARGSASRGRPSPSRPRSGPSSSSCGRRRWRCDSRGRTCEISASTASRRRRSRAPSGVRDVAAVEQDVDADALDASGGAASRAKRCSMWLWTLPSESRPRKCSG
jgi:hypothetical protein